MGPSAVVTRVADAFTTNVGRAIVNKEDEIRLCLVTLLCEGHLLIEDVPGVGKTMLAKSLARSLDCTFRRIQFTPDLLPSDVTGVRAYNQKSGDFEFRPGPVFAQILLADEINRASPKTQAALLESMEERQVTVDGETHALPKPFMVMATQNPVEYSGTFPLPEAQLDRFLMKIRIDYPSAEEEATILKRFESLSDAHSIEQTQLEPIDPALLAAARDEIAQVRVEPALYKYLVSVIRRTRDWPALSLGASPRAAIGLFFVARVLAGMDGRNFLIPDDIKNAAPAVLRHRLMLKPEADLEGVTADLVIAEILSAVEVPK